MKPTFSDSQITDHLDFLGEKIFETKHRYPHFNLLLKNLSGLAQTLPNNADVVAFERTLLYGGFSLIAPIFFRQNFKSIDLSPASADTRGAYNEQMAKDDRFIKIPYDVRSGLLDSGLESESLDLVMVPNLVHHVRDQQGLFAEINRVLRPGGKAYVFEALVRELHQEPDDYLRYTPYGLADRLKESGFEVDQSETEGGPFQAVAYCWAQAVQYFPDDERESMEKWFYETEFPRLLSFDSKHLVNNVRNHTSFPMSFSVTANKVH